MRKRLLQTTGLLFHLCFHFGILKAGLLNAQGRLYKKLFDNNRRTFLPRLNEREPIKVAFKFELINIKEVNAKEQFINVYGWVKQKWNDPFLKWNSTEFEEIQLLIIDPSKIWVPDILLYNNVDVQDHTAGGRTTYTTDVSVDNNGTAMWSSPAIFKSVCHVNVIDFPFDEQKCKLKFGSWSLDSSKLELVPWKSNGKSSNYVKNGEWELMGLKSDRSAIQYGTTTFDDITVTILIGRNFYNYCVNLIIPCALISCMIFLGFILPPESGERIGLSITVLLAMTVFQQLTSQIFPSFDFPLLGQYYFATSIELSLALGASALVINFSYRKTTKMSPRVRKLLLVWLAKVVFLHDKIKKCRPKSKAGNVKVGDDITPSASVQRQEDRLVLELKDVIINPSDKVVDYGSEHFLKSRDPYNGTANGGTIFSNLGTEETSNPLQDEGDESKVCGPQRPPVLGEDGKELTEEELTVREWEWMQATQVLDRFFLWASVIIGLVTLLAVFPRAPRLQRALGL